MEQHIYICGSWSFNISSSVLAEPWWQYRNRSIVASLHWFVQSIRWLQHTSILVIVSAHQNSLHDQSTQQKELEIGLEPMLYWQSCPKKKVDEKQVKYNVDSVCFWKKKVNSGYLWSQDVDNGRPWICLTIPRKATILEPQPETSSLFSHNDHLLPGTAKNRSV